MDELEELDLTLEVDEQSETEGWTSEHEGCDGGTMVLRHPHNGDLDDSELVAPQTEIVCDDCKKLVEQHAAQL